VLNLAEFGDSLDGELFSPDSPGYEAIRRPANAMYRDVCPPHPTAPLVVLSHRPAPQSHERQIFVSTGSEDAIAAAREAAGDANVALMGGGVATAALAAGLVDEVFLHQVPILLGGGRPFFQSLPEHVRLRLVEAVPAPGVTHLHYEVLR
jgi:dihydrofolate reductase